MQGSPQVPSFSVKQEGLNLRPRRAPEHIHRHLQLHVAGLRILEVGFVFVFFFPFLFDNICEVRLNVWGDMCNPVTMEPKSQPTLQRESHSKKSNLPRFLENFNTFWCLLIKMSKEFNS